MGKIVEKKSNLPTVVDEALQLNAAMIEASKETERDFESQEWQSNPSFQKVSEIKEVENGN